MPAPDSSHALDAVVVGAGAVGLGIGSCLLAAGHRVRFVTRPGGGELLAREGFTRTGIFGDARFPPRSFEVRDSFRDLGPGSLDYVLVCTKSLASADVAAELADAATRLPAAARIVLFQNGWGNAEVFAERFARERIFNARVITGFRRSPANAVEITVHAEPVRVGSLFGAARAEVEPLCRAIDAGGIPCETTDAIERDLWAKLLYNCALNPLGAILDVPYGALGERESARRIMAAVVAEIFAVLARSGHETHWREAEAYLADFYAKILPPTALHESSMLQDLRAGRRTEVDALNGAVVALGRRLGVPTPVNAILADLVRAIEAIEP